MKRCSIRILMNKKLNLDENEYIATTKLAIADMSNTLDTSKYTYQANIYFGIFYPDSLIGTVLDIAKVTKHFTGLAGDDAEAVIGKNTVLIASTNSDVAATMGFIASDDMTVEGPDCDDPRETSVNLEPAELEKLENNYKEAVDSLQNFYNILVKAFKSKKLPVNDLYFGWRTVNCTWDLEDSGATTAESSVSSSSSGSSSPVSVNQQKGHKGQNVPARRVGGKK